ncbi:MAG: AAA family ATPase [Nitrosopumilaceae archaeon]|nr:AAA family ATPase [Nitrosopumilaceae archaeon]
MVYISKLEISGFKSFGFKNTVIHFQPGLISISGPNGSGKSNILDAIIFALGENKPKMMRVDKLPSLIHDINKNKHGARTTKVKVHFNNFDKKIPIESDTVVLTRELNINGESLYYINHKKITRGKFLDVLYVSNISLTQLNAIHHRNTT